MNREQVRQLARENAKWPLTMKQIPKEAWPEALHVAPHPPIAVWRSRDYLAQVFREPSGVRISVNRTVVTQTGDWQDVIPWDDLQRIKREVGYPNEAALEVYPADRDVVNVANIRHLWIVPSITPWWWFRDEASPALTP